jgi:hypothetical protein
MFGVQPLHRSTDRWQPDAVGHEHGATLRGREAVAGEVDHVDVAGAKRNAFFKQSRALVDHAKEAALQDLVFADGSALNPHPH